MFQTKILIHASDIVIIIFVDKDEDGDPLIWNRMVGLVSNFCWLH